MHTGKIYDSINGQFLANINYQLYTDVANSWSGELMTIEYVPIDNGHSYIIELEDRRTGQCKLRKKFNRAVSGIPPRYAHRFDGTILFPMEEPV